MILTSRLLLRILFVLGSLASVGIAQAAVVTFPTRVAFDSAFPNATIENWDEFQNGSLLSNGTTVNGVTYTSSTGEAQITNVFLTSSPPNGLGEPTLGFFNSTDTIQFTFSHPLLAFGIDINTSSTSNGSFSAALDDDTILESVFDPFPGSSTGEFIGFSSDLPFMSVIIASTGGFTYTLDTMRQVPAPGSATVPEPSSIVFASCLVVGMALLSRRRKRAS